MHTEVERGGTATTFIERGLDALCGAGAGRWRVQVRAEPQRNEAPAFNPMHPDETPEQTLERRLRESRQVDERVVPIFSYEDFQNEVKEVGALSLASRPAWPCRRCS
jgi:hypothetical protein